MLMHQHLSFPAVILTLMRGQRLNNELTASTGCDSQQASQSRQNGITEEVIVVLGDTFWERFL